MNRIIKFRVWDFKSKNFYFSNEWYCTFYKNEQTTCHGIDKDNAENSENCITQQYIGIKDKNGKEIYEGDILKGHWLPLDLIAQVKYEPCYFKVQGIQDTKFQFGLFPHTTYTDNLVIIGNIFENPELLK